LIFAAMAGTGQKRALVGPAETPRPVLRARSPRHAASTALLALARAVIWLARRMAPTPQR
jgi:hypothetical protein